MRDFFRDQQITPDQQLGFAKRWGDIHLHPHIPGLPGTPEIAICAIADSTNIPMQEVPANLDRIPSEGALVVICHSGMRSYQVTTWLRQNGFANAVNLRGGIDSWAREMDTSMAVY